jgi:DNA-binding MarR family transcriptional regulator
MTTTQDTVRWLSTEEQRAWRGWIAAHILITEALDRDMKRDNGITMADYEILVRLSETPNRSLRMSELAQVTLSSRSRLSHQIARMESAGWVTRRECATDRRGTLAEMTEAGWELLVSAAPSHVSSVRRHLVDVLTPDEFAAAGSVGQKVADHILAGGELSVPECGVAPPGS